MVRAVMYMLHDGIFWSKDESLEDSENHPPPAPWEVYFSPNGVYTDAIVRELDKAQSSVLVQAYSITSYRIAKALLDAQREE